MNNNSPKETLSLLEEFDRLADEFPDPDLLETEEHQEPFANEGTPWDLPMELQTIAVNTIPPETPPVNVSSWDVGEDISFSAALRAEAEELFGW